MQTECCYCLKQFKNNNKKRKFCSNKCRAAYHNYNKKNILFITNLRKNCKFCENEFIPNRIDSNFCSSSCLDYWFYYKKTKKEANPSFKHRESLNIGNELRAKNQLTNKQIQVCIGSVLGDGCIHTRKSGQGRLIIGHSTKQLDYLIWKKKLLEPFVLKDNLSIYKNKGYGLQSCSFSSIVHQDFTKIGTLFYRKISGGKTKIVNRKILNMVKPLGMLIWYLDDGSISKDKAIKLSTHNFTISENRAIKIWFWQKHRIKATINEENYHKKTYHFITLNVPGSKKFLSIISKYTDDIPSCMRYKIVK